MEMQAKLMFALAVLHNFIRKETGCQEYIYYMEADIKSEVLAAERERQMISEAKNDNDNDSMHKYSDKTAQHMWIAYQVYI